MKLLLDTTVLIDALRGREDRRRLLAELVESGYGLAISAMNVGEVYAGMRADEAVRTDAFLSSLECYPVTRGVAQKAAALKSAWAVRGRTLTLADMIVAATALEHGLTLMTDNRKDFPMPNMSFYTPQ